MVAGGGNRSDNISAHIGNVLRPSDNTQCFPIFIFMSIVNIRNKLSQMLLEFTTKIFEENAFRAAHLLSACNHLVEFPMFFLSLLKKSISEEFPNAVVGGICHRFLVQ